MIDRCPTGIEGFDKLCQGGFVRNSDNLIVLFLIILEYLSIWGDILVQGVVPVTLVICFVSFISLLSS